MLKVTRLDQERRLFEENLDAWVADGKVGMTVVIKGESILGFFPTSADAFEAAKQTYGENEAFLMPPILPRNATNTTAFITEMPKSQLRRLAIQHNAENVKAMRILIEANEALTKALAAIRALVDEQAEDEGLWFDAAYISEAFLQQELRRLHALIESLTSGEKGQE